ncbi:MAG TPA: type II secretion system F family protein [Candidatus Saccharimonadales bacterium]|nr:type II secretion system F family protein [Candidatus Saccharimonadales bacterium]
MHFTYVARNKEGKTVQGALDAADRDAALATLTRQELHPVLVKSSSSDTGGVKKHFGDRVGIKDQVIFTRQLSTMVSAGVPLPRALHTLQGQSENKYFQSIITSIMKDVEAGQPLSSAFAKYPRVFSDVYVNMVRAGEAGGILDDILKRLAEQIEKDASIRKKVKGAMTYPTVILSITTVAFFFIMIYLMPKIGKIIKDLAGPGTQLPIYTRALLSLSGFMQHYALFIIIAIGLLVFFGRRYFRTPKGKYNLHFTLLHIPVLKTIVIKIAVARFARTFAALMSAGVGVIEALEVTGGAIGNKVIEAELFAAAKDVRNGKQLSEPMSKSKYFPPIVSEMLAVGEETGQIDTILVKVADFYEEEVDTVIDSLSSIIEPLLIVVLGSIVGLIAASVMGPLASLNKSIAS